MATSHFNVRDLLRPDDFNWLEGCLPVGGYLGGTDSVVYCPEGRNQKNPAVKGLVYYSFVQ